MIEMLTVLSICAILLAVGVPSFRNLLQSQQLTTTANDFFAAINLARSEAIQRGTRVDLVPAGNGSDWDSGWVVFIDQNKNQRPDSSEQIIFSHGPVPQSLTVASDFTDNDDDAKYISYTGSGRTRTNANSLQSGSVSFTLGKHVRKIYVNMLGRPRVCNPDSGTKC
ncbi:pilus assembly protein FimT [Noviherbaspirillum cavernae]|uniref:Type II secretion system protein H n=1 Tax=Noviherbaspirillum cavernae TaxID=2320862 RepID=A0A418X6E0_9BURK|nr:pilus assembly protein FimT [Noviherbaspirillum cavernae]